MGRTRRTVGVEPPYGGRRLLIDKSAYVRAGAPAVRDEWAAAIRNGQLLGCPFFTVEALYSARDVDEFRALEARIGVLPRVSPATRTYDLAIRALRDLCAARPHSHRLPAADVFIAALAHEARVGVLHYDAHYDRLAEVLDFESRWIAPPGSVD